MGTDPNPGKPYYRIAIKIITTIINLLKPTADSRPDGKKPLREHLERAVLPYFPIAFCALFIFFIGTYILTEFLSHTPNTVSINPFWWFLTTVASGIGDFLSSNFANISATVVTAFVSLKIYNGYIMRQANRDDQDSLADSIADRVNLTLSKGLLSLRNNLDSDVVSDSIARTQNTIIVETWIGWETLDRLKPGFLKAFDNGFNVTIYLLHPNSPNVGRRQLDMAPNDKFSGRDEVIRSLKKLASIREDWLSDEQNPANTEDAIKKQLQVFCYDSLPVLQIYKLQDKAVMGFYLNGGISNNGCQMEVSLEGSLGKDISKHIGQFIHGKKKRHLIPVDLALDIETQFDSVHLGCQLDDAAKQLINLNGDEIQIFCDIIVQFLTEKKRMGEVGKRKENLTEVLDKIKNQLENASLLQ